MVRQEQPDEQRSVRIVIDTRAAPNVSLDSRARAFASYALALRHAGYRLETDETGIGQLQLGETPGASEIRIACARLGRVPGDAALPKRAVRARGQEIVILGDLAPAALITGLPKGSVVITTAELSDDDNRALARQGVRVVAWQDSGWSLFS